MISLNNTRYRSMNQASNHPRLFLLPRYWSGFRYIAASQRFCVINARVLW